MFSSCRARSMIIEVGVRVLEGALRFVKFLTVTDEKNSLAGTNARDVLLTGNWTIHVLDCPPDAFVYSYLPRHIWISRHLIGSTVRSRDEAAFVLGHELAHALQGHTQKVVDVRKNFLYIRSSLLALTCWNVKPYPLFLSLGSKA